MKSLLSYVAFLCIGLLVSLPVWAQSEDSPVEDLESALDGETAPSTEAPAAEPTPTADEAQPPAPTTEAPQAVPEARDDEPGEEETDVPLPASSAPQPAPAEETHPVQAVSNTEEDEGPNLGRDLESVSRQSAESPKTMSFHLAFGLYNLANIDKGASSNPGRTIFGNANELMFQTGLEYLVWQGFGSVGIEGAVGYWGTEGKGLYQSGTASTDKTSLEFVPFKLSGVYKFDWFKDEYNIPLVPSVKFGFDYYLWWVSNQRGDIARYENESGNVKKGMGGTFGLHVAYGLLFNLDFIDPKLAANFDYDVGVNDTYLFVEGVFSYVDDFGSGSSWDMSDHTFLAGLQLEF